MNLPRVYTPSHLPSPTISLGHLSAPALIVTTTLCAVLSHPVISNSFVTPWIAALQAPLSMGFPRQEYWSELPFPSPGDLPDPGMEPHLLLGRWSLYH